MEFGLIINFNSSNSLSNFLDKKGEALAVSDIVQYFETYTLH